MVRNIQPTGARRPPASVAQRRILIYVVALVLVAVLVKACAGGHENQFEKIARGLTEAAQRNDIKAVQSYENTQTASEMNLTRVAAAADAFGPLGKLKSVKEIPTTDTTPRVHEFTLTFEHGTDHERMQLDPANKVYRFHYDTPVKT
jgi:hypothetical protein